jgi:hypothetical protein
VTDEELQHACNRIHHTAVAQLSSADPWPTKEMSGDEILVERFFPFSQQQFLPVPEISQVTFVRQPSIPARHCFFILWIVGDEMPEETKKLIDTIEKSPSFADLSSSSITTTAKTIDQYRSSSAKDLYKLDVVHTIEESQKWIKENSERLQQEDTFFKVIITWSLNKEITAINVIRAVRAEAPRVPVLIYTKNPEEIQSLLQFPNVITTYNEFELYEFVEINQETQWNPGCRVSHLNDDPLKEEKQQLNNTTNIPGMSLISTL